MDWPGLIPTLFVIWVFAALVAIGELAIAERRGRLPARPLLHALRSWLVFGGLSTACMVLNVAHGDGQIAAWQLIAVVLLMMAAGYWLSVRKT